ncbi:RyR domain-containing protein [Desulfitobacterium metallireducens]|uniref:RyR domain-containing protein n=1 Tax=Desulfitobacterium metallireducens TaxID=142877 RepID=UPI0014387F3D|nr:RyR domain-containing protein [Desulfitobacterium metallireducens]
MLVIPFIIGFIGYMPLYNNNISWAAYSALRLYQFNTDLNDINVFVEVARWLSPIATIGIVVTVFKSVRDFLELQFRTKRADSCAVYGSSIYATVLKKELGKRAVKIDNNISLRASKQILMFDNDNETIEFYNANLSNPRMNQKIYLHLNNVIRDNLQNENIHVFNLPENCARIYWRDHPIDAPCKIVIIGFGEYGQSLFTHGFVQNTFSVETGVEYHIFGDFNAFKALHYQLGRISNIDKHNPNGDAIFYHNDAWYEDLELLKEANRVILCDQSNKNIEILSQLISLCPVKEIHIKSDSDDFIQTLFCKPKDVDKPKIVSFGSPKDICSPEIVMNEELLKRAKRIHAIYLKSNICNKKASPGCTYLSDENDRCRNKNKCTNKKKDTNQNECSTWNTLNAFQRYSNISQADHIEVKLRLLGLTEKDYRIDDLCKEEADFRAKLKEKLEKELKNLTQEKKEVLSEIEHIRWCKYHYLHNWEYDKDRSDPERKHNCLVPYKELSEDDMNKDQSVYTLIPEILWP